MNRKIEKLREWGCDTDSAMRRMLNDEDFYLECLGEIPGDRYFAKLGESLRDGDTSVAFDCAHTLKGLLANVGLTPMYKKTVEIVEPLRCGQTENLTEKYDELIKMKDFLSEVLK